MPPLGQRQILSPHHHGLGPRQTEAAPVVPGAIEGLQIPSPQHHTLNPQQTATSRALPVLYPQLPLAIPQTTVTLAANPTLRTIPSANPSSSSTLIPNPYADFDRLNARDGRTSPFDRATDPSHLTGIPTEIRVTAIELTVLVVFMVVLVVLLIWLFIIALDFALRYIRDRLEVEAERRVDEEVVRRERASEEGGLGLDVEEVNESTGLLRSFSGRGAMDKKRSWAIERGRVRKLEKEIERRVKEERARENRLKEIAREDTFRDRAKSSAMELDADGNPRRRSAE